MAACMELLTPSSMVEPLRSFISGVGGKDMFQKKALNFLVNGAADYVLIANQILRSLASQYEIADLIDSYLWLNDMATVERLAFVQSGMYRHSTLAQVEDTVYANRELMAKYMKGLAVSLALWPSHLRIMKMFGSCIEKASPRSYLEVGPGHGQFFREALQRQPSIQRAVGIDLSPASLLMTEKTLRSAEVDFARVSLRAKNFLHSERDETFDFVVMGEVLEHVENPSEFIRGVREVLNPGGRLFLSTCCNSPAIDHIYLFRHPREVLALLTRHGFRVVEELVIPQRGASSETWESQLVNINVAYLAEA